MSRPKFLHIGGWADGQWLEADTAQKFQRQTHPRSPADSSLYRRSDWCAGAETYTVYAQENLRIEDIFELLLEKYNHAPRC